MKKSEFEAGSYLYKLHGNYKKDAQRVFIHTGYITADGYGVMLGFLEDGTLCKSSGHGNYQYGTAATVEAMPYSGYQFSHWSDGATYNPYTFAVVGNVQLTAYFYGVGVSSLILD